MVFHHLSAKSLQDITPLRKIEGPTFPSLVSQAIRVASCILVAQCLSEFVAVHLKWLATSG